VRASFQTRHDIHQALFHRLLDIFAPTRRGDARQPVAENLAHCRWRLGGQLDRLAKIPLRQERGDLVPQAAVAQRGNGQIDPAFNGDRQTHHQYRGDRIHHESAALEESDYVTENTHRADSRTGPLGSNRTPKLK
jgi:hypothetical protein